MLTKSFTRCIAKITGDGCLYKNGKRGYVRYHNTCQVLIDEFKKDMKKEFPDVNCVKGINNIGVPFIHYDSKKIISKFLEYLEDYRSYFVKVPEKIKLSNLDIKRNYLRALFDDDGSACLRIFEKNKEWKRSLNITSNSFELLEGIKRLLFDFGIKSNKIIQNNRNSRKDNSFVLTITGKGNLIKYNKEIGFKHPLKIRTIDLIIKSYCACYTKNIMEFFRVKEEMNKIRYERSLIKVERLSRLPTLKCSTTQERKLA